MKSSARTVLLLLGDMLSLYLAFFAMLEIAFFHAVTTDLIYLHAFPFLILGMSWIFIFFLFDLYDTKSSRLTIPRLQKIFLAFILSVLVGFAFFYLIPFFYITPKSNLLIFASVTLLLFILWRRVFYLIFASYFQRSVAFVVSEEKNLRHVQDLKKYIDTYPQSGFKVTHIYKNFDSLLNANPSEVPQVLIVSKEIWQDQKNFIKIQNMRCEVLDLSEAYEDILGRIPVETIDEGWFIHNVNYNQIKIKSVFERTFSILLAIIMVIITLPITVLIAVLIKLEDGGNIFYTQSRVGKNNKQFKLYKFRSMVKDAEKDGPEWSTKNDPRATKIGNILRKIHLDEIPQMLNVILGDMTIVGPRPERPVFVEALEKEIPFYNLRHIITPGFTGWAQIKFRYARDVMDSKEKFEYDLYFLKNKNFFMDLGIIARTIQIVFTH
ncbi:sugar transferase [Patescibacteria group bacterium]|nr:sugar transferase [Patescibacteria group bacterium]